MTKTTYQPIITKIFNHSIPFPREPLTPATTTFASFTFITSDGIEFDMEFHFPLRWPDDLIKGIIVALQEIFLRVHSPKKNSKATKPLNLPPLKDRKPKVMEAMRVELESAIRKMAAEYYRQATATTGQEPESPKRKTVHDVLRRK